MWFCCKCFLKWKLSFVTWFCRITFILRCMLILFCLVICPFYRLCCCCVYNVLLFWRVGSFYCFFHQPCFSRYLWFVWQEFGFLLSLFVSSMDVVIRVVGNIEALSVLIAVFVHFAVANGFCSKGSLFQWWNYVVEFAIYFLFSCRCNSCNRRDETGFVFTRVIDTFAFVVVASSISHVCFNAEATCLFFFLICCRHCCCLFDAFLHFAWLVELCLTCLRCVLLFFCIAIKNTWRNFCLYWSRSIAVRWT